MIILGFGKKNTIWFNKYLMKVLKWDKDFTIQKESSLAPVWIRLPELPLPLFNKQALVEIAQIASKPLKIDEHTKNRFRPNYTRVCIEMDILKEKPEVIILQMGDREVEQKIFYENMPTYCTHCHHMRHNDQEYYQLRKEENKNFLFQKRRQKIKLGKRPMKVRGAIKPVDNPNKVESRLNDKQDKLTGSMEFVELKKKENNQKLESRDANTSPMKFKSQKEIAKRRDSSQKKKKQWLHHYSWKILIIKWNQ